jgi:hypothetical protein
MSHTVTSSEKPSGNKPNSLSCESKLKFKKNNKIEIWAKSISSLELDLDKAESNEITDWKDEKNYWLFLNQKCLLNFLNKQLYNL